MRLQAEHKRDTVRRAAHLLRRQLVIHQCADLPSTFSGTHISELACAHGGGGSDNKALLPGICRVNSELAAWSE